MTGAFVELADELERLPSRLPCGSGERPTELVEHDQRPVAARIRRSRIGDRLRLLQTEPACSLGPVAITADELGAHRRDGRVDLPLIVDRNGARRGYGMRRSFPEHIAHAALTRSPCAGTIIGDGTVSNEKYRGVGSSRIAERHGIETLDESKPRTEFTKFGDRVRTEATLPDGAPPFGVIGQRVVPG